MSAKNLSSGERHSLYKKKPDWREVYRRRCLDRLRERRMELYTKRRGLEMGDPQPGSSKGEGDSDSFIQMVMTSELKALHNAEDMDEETEWFSGNDSEEMDEALALIEQIQKEMKAEEARIIAEYEAYKEDVERSSTEALCEAIALMSTGPTCPICTKSPLMSNKGAIFCKCGVRIFTEQDHISLDFVERQLEEGKQLHQCDGQPVFTVKESFGITSMIMTCQECDFMYIVI